MEWENTRFRSHDQDGHHAMTLKLGMQHLGLGPYQVYSDDDPWLTWTYLKPKFLMIDSLLVHSS